MYENPSDPSKIRNARETKPVRVVKALEAGKSLKGWRFAEGE